MEPLPYTIPKPWEFFLASPFGGGGAAGDGEGVSFTLSASLSLSTSPRGRGKRRLEMAPPLHHRKNGYPLFFHTISHFVEKMAAKHNILWY